MNECCADGGCLFTGFGRIDQTIGTGKNLIHNNGTRVEEANQRECFSEFSLEEDHCKLLLKTRLARGWFSFLDSAVFTVCWKRVWQSANISVTSPWNRTNTCGFVLEELPFDDGTSRKAKRRVPAQE
mmetsp:Transcript_18181/g.45009  ORF Transcript_18181/g.45009 Transcript_18181/m.45009 type:complete len:127 (-) Transcript_18181:81-461(-)